MTTALEKIRNDLKVDDSTFTKAFVVVAPRSFKRDFDVNQIEQLHRVALKYRRTFLLCAGMVPIDVDSKLRIITRSIVTNCLKSYSVKELWTFGNFVTDEYQEIVRAACLAHATIRNCATEGSTAERYANMHISWQEHNQAKVA